MSRAEPAEADVLTERLEEEDEPDYGYAPPPPVALPDLPLDFSLEEFPPPLTREELSKEIAGLYLNSPKDENGVSLRLKKEQEEWERLDEERIKQTLRDIDTPAESPNKQVDAMIAAGPKKQRPQLSRVDSMQAKSAAEALSEPQPRLPSAALRPTQASEQKRKGILSSTKPRPLNTSTASGPSRTAHVAVSKNTIGFPKAKKPPSIIPKGVGVDRSGPSSVKKPAKVDQSKIHPKDFRDLYGYPPIESDMWFRLKEYELLEKDESMDADLVDDLFEPDFFPFENSRLDDEDFQLPMPQ